MLQAGDTISDSVSCAACPLGATVGKKASTPNIVHAPPYNKPTRQRTDGAARGGLYRRLDYMFGELLCGTECLIVQWYADQSLSANIGCVSARISDCSRPTLQTLPRSTVPGRARSPTWQ